MFKSLHNLMKLRIRVIPQTPLLVASGKGFDVTRPDIEFVRLNTPEGETLYVPGSSLKGVIRAGCEAVLAESKRFAGKICITSETMCHDLHKDKKDNRDKVPYRTHCPVCRLFGSGHLASRLEISDLLPYAPGDTQAGKKERIETMNRMISTRTGIRINRKTGKTDGGALFNYEILGGGEFFGEITLTNYQLYQPGLVFTLFDLADEGILRFGHSKSRGLGVIKFIIDTITVMQLGQLRGDTLKGIGVLNKYRDNDFYEPTADTIDKPYPEQHEDQTLYSLLTFGDKTGIEDVTGRCKGKIDALLG